MKLKKKITRQCFDYKAEKDYYREARVCPNCGNRQELSSVEYIKAMCNNKVTITENRLWGGGYGYECKRCGCQWEVSTFKG